MHYIHQIENHFSRYKAMFHFPAWGMLLFAFTALISACDSDDVGENYYTFTGETMGQYIEARPEIYSEFSLMLDTTGVKSLLNAYGKYTCFAPTNLAIYTFYENAGISGINEMSMDSIRKLVYNHIIKDFVLDTEYFTDGFLSNLTMSGRYLRISFDMSNSRLNFLINHASLVTEPNLLVHNGVLHQIDHVISPTENTLVEAIAQDDKFTLFYEALVATGLDKSLLPIKDDAYHPSDLFLEIEGDGKQTTGIGSLIRIPKERKYGFTAFVESNETFNEYGITSVETMAQYAKSIYDQVYPEDASIDDYTDNKNSLNRFVAYHLVNKKMPLYYIMEAYDNTGQDYDTKGETHAVKTVDMYEYIEPMCPNTLIEVRSLRSSNEYNVFNMISETGEAIRITENYDNDALNGVYHEIDGILAYTRAFETELSGKRLRMDAASFFPELANNNIRVGSASKDYPSERWSFPPGFLERVDASETSVFSYFNADDRFLDYQGDEIFVPRSLYEFTITTPPIPAGTYEIRFAYQPNGNRGAAQMYWDGKPCGIPLDLRLAADNPKIGFVVPGNDPTDPEGFENDKMMRNRGYMKGPASFKVIDEDWWQGVARYTPASLRRILGIYHFPQMENHTFSVKASVSGEFMFDFMEFVPVEVIEKEDIY